MYGIDYVCVDDSCLSSKRIFSMDGGLKIHKGKLTIRSMGETFSMKFFTKN